MIDEAGFVRIQPVTEVLQLQLLLNLVNREEHFLKMELEPCHAFQLD